MKNIFESISRPRRFDYPEPYPGFDQQLYISGFEASVDSARRALAPVIGAEALAEMDAEFPPLPPVEFGPQNVTTTGLPPEL